MFSLWSPTFRFPLSGDVSQDIEPQLTKIAGNADIEAHVVRDVASYGRQLGLLTEAVLELAVDSDGPAVTKLRDLAQAVEIVKTERAEALTQEAETALARLKQHDPAAWKTLIDNARG